MLAGGSFVAESSIQLNLYATYARLTSQLSCRVASIQSVNVASVILQSLNLRFFVALIVWPSPESAMSPTRLLSHVAYSPYPFLNMSGAKLYHEGLLFAVWFFLAISIGSCLTASLFLNYTTRLP